MTGPKISWWKMVCLGVMPLKMVGAVQKPRANRSPAGRPPPTSSLAPSALVVSMKASTLSCCMRLHEGPISTPSSNEEPCFSLEAATTRRRVTSGAMDSWIRTRAVAEQICPVFQNAPKMIHSSAASTLASSNTMAGDLPPSSRVTRLMPSAAAFITLVPVGTEPVKVTLSVSLWVTRSLPMRPSPVTTCRTPLGRPTAAAAAASSSVE
jgi:hypothetical protein